MKNNLIFRFICSIPVILITLYFLPFLGICLILFRFYMYRDRIYKTPIFITVLGIIILIPQLLNYIFSLISFDSSKLPYFNKVVQSNIYVDFVKYGKFLVTLGIIVLILSFVIKNLVSKLSNKLESGIKNYIEKEEIKSREIAEKNDLIVREREAEARNLHVIKCPYCGGDNMVSTPTTTCKYCRRHITSDKNK